MNLNNLLNGQKTHKLNKDTITANEEKINKNASTKNLKSTKNAK